MFLYDYPDPLDREIVGLVASALAYGRVAQILKSVDQALKVLGPAPHAHLAQASPAGLGEDFRGFRHRFAGGAHLAFLLSGIQRIQADFGSLRACLSREMERSGRRLWPALNAFCARLRAGGDPGHLVPVPDRGSACKRLLLFLRWMVRRDAVDPGGWEIIGAENLIVPLDVHMHRAGRLLGFTSRHQADARTAMEVTEGFARWVPEDPVRYDFVLTRVGIWGKSLADHLIPADTPPPPPEKRG